MTDYSALGIQLMSYDSAGNPLDVTHWVADIAPLATTAIDLVGYVKTTTRILLVNCEAPQLETRFNGRWGIGNKLVLYVRDSTDTLVRHRTFRILDRFFDAGRSPQSQRQGIPSLELELGDLFALRDLRNPPPNDVKVPRNDPWQEVTVISQISNWLEAFDLPPVTILPGDEVPTQSTVTRVRYTGGSSILEHIGKLLYLNTRFILWVDPYERVRVRRINRRVPAYDFNDPATQISSYANLDLGSFGLTDENDASFVSERSRSFRSFESGALAFEPLLSADFDISLEDCDCLINERSKSEREKPAGLIRVSGTATYKDRYEDPDPQTTYTNDGDLITSETLNTLTLFVFQTQTFSRSGTVQIPGADPNDTFAQEVGQFEEIEKLDFGGSLPGFPNSNPYLEDHPGLAAHLETRTLTIKEQRREPDGDLSALLTTKTVRTKYHYTLKSRYIQGVLARSVELDKIVTVTRILPNTQPEPTGGHVLRITEVNTKRWREQQEGIYYYNETTIRPESEENRRFSQTQSSVGRSTPPATHWIPQEFVNKTRPIYAEFLINSPPDVELTHVRNYPVGAYLDNNRSAAVLAKHLGALLVGRSEGQNLGFRPPDHWLADPIPAPVVQLDDAVYLMDIPVVLFEPKRTYLGGLGIYLGAWDSGTETLTEPYDEGAWLWAYDHNTLVDTEADDLVEIP